MKSLRLVSIVAVVISRLACGGECSTAWFDRHPDSIQILRRLQWNRYWLNQDPFLIDGIASNIALFEGSEATGYCIERGECRRLLRLGPEGKQPQVISDAPFKLRLLWREPVAVFESETIQLELCRLPKLAMIEAIPDAIKLRKRPEAAEAIITAIIAQGLLSVRSSVSVPFFDDTDDVIFITVQRPEGRTETLAVVRKSSVGWWTFRPVSDFGSPGVRRLIAKRVLEAEMVRVFGAHDRRWVK